MTLTETMNEMLPDTPPPTPAEFIAAFVDRFFTPDPNGPYGQKEAATHRLLMQSLAMALGPNDPLARLLNAYQRGLSKHLNAWDGDTPYALDTLRADMEAAHDELLDEVTNWITLAEEATE